MGLIDKYTCSSCANYEPGIWMWKIPLLGVCLLLPTIQATKLREAMFVSLTDITKYNECPFWRGGWRNVVKTDSNIAARIDCILSRSVSSKE